MAESKRTAHLGKMNRDLDDRLVPDGEYRLGQNVNIGRSDGSDVGAVENLQGNELILSAQQAGLEGTTIGTVRDAGNDRIYFFNSSDNLNALYEFDQKEDTIRTIISDNPNREAPLPTCTPDVDATITEPDGNAPDRPNNPDLPPPPLGYCADSNATNSGQRADGSTADTVRDYVDDSICTYPPSFNCSGTPSFTCSDPGNGGGQYASLGECQTACVDPGGGGGGTPRFGILTCSPSSAQINTGSVTLTFEIRNFTNFPTTGGFTFTVTGGATSHVFTFTSNGTMTTTAAVESSVGTVAYTATVTDAGGQGFGSANGSQNTCSVAWFDGTPPPTMFLCTNASTGTCAEDASGTHSSLAACQAAADCQPPATNIACTSWQVVNPAGNNNVLHFYVNCSPASPDMQTCTVFVANYGAGTTFTQCIPSNVTDYCLNDPLAVPSPASGATLTGLATQLITDTLGNTGTAVTSAVSLNFLGSCS